MSRLFLTNIDLNTNELQNAVIQNLSSAPLSGNKEGRVYYDVTNKALYLYTDGQWKPLASGGAAASSIELTGDVTGTANVDPATGKLTVETTVDSSFVTLNGTQSLQNKTFAGNTYFQSAGGAGGTNNYLSVDNSTGVLTVNSGYGLNLTSTNDVTITSNNSDIVLNPDGYAYYGSKTPGRRIATIDDITNVTLDIQGATNQISVDNESGVTTISLPSYIDIPNGEMHLRKTEYWNDGTTYGIITNNGNQFKIVSMQGDIVLDSHSGIINATGSELHTDKIELTNTGILADNGGNLKIVSLNGDIVLDSHSGTLNIQANNIVTNDAQIQIRKTEYWNSGSQYGVITENGNTFKVIATSGDLDLESNNGSINLSPDSGNVNINGTLHTDSIRAYNGDWLYVNADNIVLNNAVTVGGDGTSGAFYVKDSNGNSVFYVDVPANETGFSGNVTIGGDLNVQGTLNAVNRTEINIEDNTIRLNTGFTGTPSVDAGIIVERGTANDTAIIWNESNDQWTLTNDGNNYYAIARKYVEVIGDASNTSFDVVHNLGTRDITVMVRENNAEYNVVETDVLMKDGNTVTIGFTDAPALNSYKVIIVG